MRSDHQLRIEYPFIRWDEPVSILVSDSNTPVLGCRFCIARYGFAPAFADKRVTVAYPSVELWREHWEQVHDPTAAF